MKREILEIRSLSVRYKHSPKEALKNISLCIGEGERVALIGPNGSGKTTLLMAIIGLVDYSGYISFEGEELRDDTLKYMRTKSGFLFSIPDDQILFPSVTEDVMFSLLQRGIKRDEAERVTMDILERLSLSQYAKTPPSRLSYGERLKVALAGVLVYKPLLLLLDEPSAGLDPIAKKRLIDILIVTNSAQVVATHDTEFAQRLCNRYILIDDGSIVEDGTDFDRVRSYWDEKMQ